MVDRSSDVQHIILLSFYNADVLQNFKSLLCEPGNVLTSANFRWHLITSCIRYINYSVYTIQHAQNVYIMIVFDLLGMWLYITLYNVGGHKTKQS